MIVKLQKLSTTVPIQTLNFDNTIPTNGTSVVVPGFGYTQEGMIYTGNMRKVTVNIIDIELCSNLTYVYNTTAMLCAGIIPDGGKDACLGDGGAPLYYNVGSNKVQVGMVSYGEGCGQPNKPGVYTKISAYEEWIKDQICGYTSDDKSNLPTYCAGRPTGLRRPVPEPCPCKRYRIFCRIRNKCKLF
jgi:secreted trypsin-like serine protease